MLGGRSQNSTLRSGFTIVELLVVISLTAILAAIIFAAFPRARGMARQAACVSNCRQIVAAARMYASDYDLRLPPAMTRGAPPPHQGYSWTVLLQPYMKSEEIVVCPNDPKPREAGNLVGSPSSYGMNFRLTYNTAFGWNPGPLTSKLTTTHEHSRRILVFGLSNESDLPGASFQVHRLSRVEARHGDRVMFGFLDGHVNAMIPEETVQPQNLWE